LDSTAVSLCGIGVPTEVELPIVERSHYEILGELSRGGFGRILRARDRRSGRLVAIKEMLDAGHDVARFVREALLTCNLQHPAIVPVYEIGRWPDGVAFYAMKLVAGRSLAEAIQDAVSRPDRLALLSHVTAVADALAYAHELGIIHRDLKPANVLVGPFGETVVIDWGLGKDIAEAEGRAEPLAPAGTADLTMAGALLGTPAYMSPEQARGEPVDHPTDVYALGAMLYHVLAGAMPYAESTSVDHILDQVRAGPPRPLAALDPALPHELVAITAKAMAHDAAARYPSARELAEDLRRFATGQLVSAHDYSLGQLVRRWIGRHRSAIAVAATAVVVLAGIAVYSVQRVRDERDEARTQRVVAEQALADARRANEEAARTLAGLHRELGRQELEAADPLRALAHLAQSARSSGRLDGALAYLVGRAVDALEPRRWSARSASRSLHSLAIAADSSVAVSASIEGIVERWELASGRRLASLTPDDSVDAAEISRDGRWVAAVAGTDLVMWDGAGSGSSYRVHARPAAAFTEVAVSPVADIVATGDGAGTIELRRLGEQPPLVRWAAHDGAVTSLAYTPAGDALISTGRPGDVALWDTATGRRLRPLQAGASDGQSPPAAVDARGKRALLIARDGASAVLYDLRSGRRLATLAPAPADSGLNLNRADIDSSGTRAVTIDSGGSTMLWDADRGRALAELPDHAFGMVRSAFSPDGHILATLDGRGLIRLWDARTGALMRLLAQPPGRVGAIAFTPDGRLLTASHAGELFSWSVQTKAVQTVLMGHTDQTRRLDYLGDGSLLVTGSRDGGLRIWDTATGGEVRRIDRAHAGRVFSVAGSADGQRIVSGGTDAMARVWDARSGRLLHTLGGHHATVVSARWVAGGAIATASEDGTMRVWSSDGALRCATEPLGHPLTGLTPTPDGTSLLGAAAGPVSVFWRADDCRLIHRLDTGHESTLVGAVSPDGRTAVLGGMLPLRAKTGSTVYLVDLGSGALRPLATDRSTVIRTVAFDPKGSRLVTASVDIAAIDLWDVRTSERAAVVIGPPAAATAVAFDATGELLIGGSADGVLRVWNAASGQLVSSQPGHRAGIYFMRVRPDGAQIATAALEPAPRLWRFPRWSGSGTELAELVRCRVPWLVSSGALVSIDLASLTGCR
jgi:eukaryotic-like serine/threonine-protein kinase